MGKKNPILHLAKIKNLDIRKAGYGEILNVIGAEMDPLITDLLSKNKLAPILKKFVIIRLVTIFETFMKNFAIKLIDENDLNVNTLFGKGEISIPLKNFSEIKKGSFTKGRIVASNFNFQSPNDVNFVFSRLLKIPFFDTVLEYTKLRGKPVADWDSFLTSFDDFLKTFDNRNEIIHSLREPKVLEHDGSFFHKLSLDFTYFIVFSLITINTVMGFRIKKTGIKEVDEFLIRGIKEYEKQLGKQPNSL